MRAVAAGLAAAAATLFGTQLKMEPHYDRRGVRSDNPWVKPCIHCGQKTKWARGGVPQHPTGCPK